MFTTSHSSSHLSPPSLALAFGPAGAMTTGAVFLVEWCVFRCSRDGLEGGGRAALRSCCELPSIPTPHSPTHRRRNQRPGRPGTRMEMPWYVSPRPSWHLCAECLGGLQARIGMKAAETLSRRMRLIPVCKMPRRPHFVSGFKSNLGQARHSVD